MRSRPHCFVGNRCRSGLTPPGLALVCASGRNAVSIMSYVTRPKSERIGPVEGFGRVTMQVFVRHDDTMIAAPVQCDVDGIPKGPHCGRVPSTVDQQGWPASRAGRHSRKACRGQMKAKWAGEWVTVCGDWWKRSSVRVADWRLVQFSCVAPGKWSRTMPSADWPGATWVSRARGSVASFCSSGNVV